MCLWRKEFLLFNFRTPLHFIYETNDDSPICSLISWSNLHHNFFAAFMHIYIFFLNVYWSSCFFFTKYIDTYVYVNCKKMVLFPSQGIIPSPNDNKHSSSSWWCFCKLTFYMICLLFICNVLHYNIMLLKMLLVKQIGEFKVSQYKDFFPTITNL